MKKRSVALYRRFCVDSVRAEKTSAELESYHARDRLFIAGFAKRSDIIDPEVLKETLNQMMENALMFADASYKDAITSALMTETRIATMSKNPADWVGIIIVVQYRSIEDDEVLIFAQGDQARQSSVYKATMIGFEITPITQITLGIDPYHCGTYLRNLTFESKNI